jgi:carotenoid cleavage oxygenase
MAPSIEPQVPAANDAPVNDETTITDLAVLGTLPPALCGQYLRIGPNPIVVPSPPSDRIVAEGMVHAVALRAGRAVAYRNRWIRTDAASRRLGVEPVPGPRVTGRDASATNLVLYAGMILSLSDGALAYQLTDELTTVRRVDLAGGARPIGAHPRNDPATGELHLLSSPGEPSCEYHVISAGGLTRRSRALSPAPVVIHSLAVTNDRLLLVGDGVLGVTDRHRGGRIAWLPATITATDHVVSSYDDGDAVVVYVVGQALRRMALDVSADRVDAAVLDQAPACFARINERLALTRHRFLYVVPAGGTSVHKHDLMVGTREAHDFGAGRHPGEVLFVDDPDRAGAEDGGWVLGLVHDDAARRADLVVLDAARFGEPAVATVTIPRRVPDGLHGLWVPTGR